MKSPTKYLTLAVATACLTGSAEPASATPESRAAVLFLLIEPVDPSAPTLFATRTTHVNAIAPRHGNDPISVPLLEGVIRSFGELVRGVDDGTRDLAGLWGVLREPMGAWCDGLPEGFVFVRAFGE